MYIRSFLFLFAVAGSACAGDGFEVSHKSDSAQAKPMAWSLQLLEKGKHVFDKRGPKKAPGATLSFRLPKVDVDQGENQVVIVRADRRIPVTMLSNNTFVLGQDNLGKSSDALVVVNRNFPKGEFNHPLVQVRSPGLPGGVRRMGDLRLSCEAQMEMAKGEGFKFRALVGAVNMFGFDICKELEITKLDAPSSKYDTVTVEDGNRRLVQAAKDKNVVELGDNAWSDDARISYTLNGSLVE
ncbi:hypothetical protein [Massilia sp. H6]|uniref:hypothetical protein n=1 Tax=Massilia sp. H6 TaxID=2970464 RepID=UPI00216A8766|nr:hypothetical protein [Massilia sp. H6]UVW29525.1 hypothetical protein NRS07_05180 [Massilia sp. H6]